MATKTASFLTPGLQPPYAQEMALAGDEQQQLAQALLKVRDAPGAQPVAAGRMSALNFEGVGNAIQQAMLEKKLEVAKKKAADVQGNYQKDLVVNLKKYIANRDGGEEVLPTEASGLIPSKVNQPNPLAFREGQLSPFPEVRGMAEEDRKSHEAVYGKLLDKASLGSAAGAGGDPRLLRPKSDQKVIDGAVVEMGQEAGQLPQVLAPVTQSTLSSGTVVNNKFGGAQDSVDKAPKTTISTGDKAGTKFLDSEVEDISKNRAKLESTVPGQLRALASAEQSARAGAFQGPVSGFVSGLAGLLGEFNLAPDQTKALLTNTQLLDSDMGRFVLSALKVTGTNPSNADREYAERTAGGKKLSPDGLQAVIRAARADLVNSLITHNKRVDTYAPDVPLVAKAKIAIPDVANVAPGAPGVPREALDIQGYLPDKQSGLYMPRARPAAAKTTSGKARYTPQELERLRTLGIDPLEE